MILLDSHLNYKSINFVIYWAVSQSFLECEIIFRGQMNDDNKIFSMV